MSTPEISVVIVSWECNEELVACVSSLAPLVGQARPGVEVIVVDNASRGFPGQLLRTVLPDMRVIVNTSNRGFGPAANQGVASARADVVLLLNPDTRAQGDPLSPLLSAFSADPEIVAVAPRLCEAGTGSGEPQEIFQLRRLPGWSQAVRELLLLDRLFPGNRHFRADRYLDRDRDEPFRVEQPAAAALAVRRSVFLAVGGFDEEFVPAWFEDVDLCARLARVGALVYWPASRFLHAGGVAARTLGHDAFLPLYYRNAVRYWRKHHGAAAAAAYRLLLATGMLLRLTLLPLRAGVPRPRGEAARAYWRTLWMATRTPAARACSPPSS